MFSAAGTALIVLALSESPTHRQGTFLGSRTTLKLNLDPGSSGEKPQIEELGFLLPKKSSCGGSGPSDAL